MKIIHFKRTFFWSGQLIYTLFKFWISNPKETLAILFFIIEKAVVSPKFFSRNILIEKHIQEFENFLLETVELYRKFGKGFNLTNPSSYKKLERNLSDKTQIIYFLVRKLKPEIIVETGVAAGRSTGTILQAIKDNGFGKLYSIDLPFQWYIYGDHKLHLDSLPAGKAPGYLIPKHLKKYWQLILGNTYDKLPKLLKKLGKISLFFHDSEHSYRTMMFEYEQSWSHLRRGGLLLSDDVSYTKAFKKFSNKNKIIKIIFKDLGIIKKYV